MKLSEIKNLSTDSAKAAAHLVDDKLPEFFPDFDTNVDDGWPAEMLVKDNVHYMSYAIKSDKYRPMYWFKIQSNVVTQIKFDDVPKDAVELEEFFVE